VETLDANRRLREDYGAFTQAVAMLEAVDHVAQEDHANNALYRMLAAALRTLSEHPGPAVAVGFFWKLLSLEGVHPVLDGCARCDTPVPPEAVVAFDLNEGGVVCSACVTPGAAPVNPQARAIVARILGGGLKGVLDDPPSRALNDAETLALRALEHHLERRLRSRPLLLSGLL
jgi:DNA repair protein RecO (recombination protein O)